jgi:mannan endo-1,4-beta-mannosidase
MTPDRTRTLSAPPASEYRVGLTALVALVASAVLVACGGTTPTPVAPAPGTPPATALPVPAPASPAPASRPAYWADGHRLRDPCGAEVVLRGVNKMAVFMDRRGDSFPEIGKTGANAVRIMWMTSVSASEAVQTLQRAVDARLIPIWQMHDATGKWSEMPKVEAFWAAPETLKVLRQFESRLIVNLANEPGTDVSDTEIVTVKSRIIRRLRDAGLRMPLMITASGYGRAVEQMLRVAPTLQGADPLRNLLFDWHVYDSGNDMPARIDRAFASAIGQGIPLVIGEFGSVEAGRCSAEVPWRKLITSAQQRGIGWLAWSWDNRNSDCGAGGDSPFNLVSDGINFSTLRPGWATEVTLTDPASIRNTSQRTTWQVTGTCTAR